MTDVFYIGAQTSLKTVESRLMQNLAILFSDAIKINVKRSKSRFFNILNCEVNYGEVAGSLVENRRLCRQGMADALAGFFIEEWEEDILLWMLRKRFSCFSNEEKERIVRLAKNRLRLLDKLQSNTTQGISRENRLSRSFYTYLIEQNQINLNGFLYFRLGLYKEDLERVLCHSVEQFFDEKEYREFVELLRYFVALLKPKHDLVHVMLRPPHDFVLSDQDGKVLHTGSLLSEYHLGSHSIKQEDLLVSALLSAAPKRITLHLGTFRDQPSLARMLQQVFAPRVTVCQSCAYCQQILSRQLRDD